MAADDFLHPDHVVPAVKFIAASVKFTHFFKTHMGMELGAVFAEVLIFFLGISDTRIHIRDPHAPQLFLQGFVQPSPQAAFFSRSGQYKCSLRRTSHRRPGLLTGRHKHNQGCGQRIFQEVQLRSCPCGRISESCPWNPQSAAILYNGRGRQGDWRRCCP